MRLRAHESAARRSCRALSIRFALLIAVAPAMGCGRIGVELLGDGGGRDMPGGGGTLACDAGQTEPGRICGCGEAEVDSDDDDVPDCIDFCPGRPDQTSSGECGCAAAAADADDDGTSNCMDRCPFDPNKQAPGMCGCGGTENDSDSDGTPDCLDECPQDAKKSLRGACGCDRADDDTDLDGVPDCNDRCSGRQDATYEPETDCGVGYCRAHNTASSCLAGVETACLPSAPLASTDESCDGVDDDCDGTADDDFNATTVSCGMGVCTNSGVRSCRAGSIDDSCVAGMPTSSGDATCNALDDDCDGNVDEDVATMPTTCAGGACAATGSIACVNGVLVDSCQATAPISATDTSCDNVDDDCSGMVDEDFPAMSTSCGTGACARSGMLTCTRGMAANSCRAAMPSTNQDTSCNGADDDCDGRVDEEFAVTPTNCGQGVCASTGVSSCMGGMTRDSCTPSSPTSSQDDAAVPGNGLDDDCDGSIDEDLPACDTTTRTYDTGSYALSIPGNCRFVTVRLWGAGGAAGQSEGLAGGGSGGPGGYATATVLVAPPLQLYVGAGAANNCNAAGSNPGSSTYDGGSGGNGTGANGADGVASGGGNGGQPSSGARGGNGHFGGGGGGQGMGGLGASGNAGGGGAATVFLVNGMRAAVAGGGGGGGGAQSLSIIGTLAAAGGDGGSGCRGNGLAPNANGGGGGGGGLCLGGTTQAGSARNPAFSGDIPAGRAQGGASSCGAGGAGYATVSFSP